MYRWFKIFLSAAVFLSSITFSGPLQADVIDNYCYLEAGNVDVYVVVWEEDRQGNKGKKIWQGIVKKSQRVKIQSFFGSIRYSGTVYVKTQDALSGDQSRWCSNAATIGVP
jgi:hypothetical protein